jgi:hypothetical protein
MMTDVRTSIFELRYLPYGCVCPNWNLRRPDDCSDLSIIVFWKEILKLWSNTECRPDGLLNRLDECKL